MPAGRPSAFSEELAERITDLIAEGQSMRRICQHEDMPDRTTVIRWMAKHEDFATKCAHARAIQADAVDDEIDEVIRECRHERIPPDVARVVLSGLQWRASKLAPKKYGDKVKVEHEGEQKHTITFRRKTDKE